MSRVRAEGTKIELAIEMELRGAGVPYESHPKDIVGRPDFVIRRKKIAVFCDSEFWHGYRMGPKSISKLPPFWRVKISSNRARDRVVNRYLRSRGWTVLRFWAKDIERRPASCVSTILEAMGHTAVYPTGYLQGN